MTRSIIQVTIPTIEKMPRLPQPLHIIDWREKARAFDSFVFDRELSGEYFPLIWTDIAQRNFPQETFGIYTVVGDPRMGPSVNNGEAHEAITCISAVLGGLMTGIDKAHQDGRNYVAMCKNYFNREDGRNIVMDYTSSRVQPAGGGYGRSFWYDLFPNMLFFALDSYSSGESGFDDIVRVSAEQWQRAAVILDRNCDHTCFDFESMKPVDNGRWREPDSAAGIAWLMYMAHAKFGDQDFLETARSLLLSVEERESSPFYEVLLPFGVTCAARMNAEAGTSHDVRKMLDWCFTGMSECRPGWGVVSDRWGDYDMHGLQGSVTDSQGYAFAMNTFDMVAALLPLVRYAPEFAKAIGRWCLNAVNASRFFYPGELPQENQTHSEYTGTVHNLIGYEGIRRYDKELLRSRDDEEARNRTPFAQGDSHRWGKRIGLTFPPISHLSLYGSSHVGLMGGLVTRTDVEGILQLDCLASDFYHAPAYPTYLLYNPYNEAREVSLGGEGFGEDVRLYDLVGGDFAVMRSSNREPIVRLEPDTASLFVLVPKVSPIAERDGKLYAGDTVIRYGAPAR